MGKARDSATLSRRKLSGTFIAALGPVSMRPMVARRILRGENIVNKGYETQEWGINFEKNRGLFRCFMDFPRFPEGPLLFLHPELCLRWSEEAIMMM